MVGQTLSHYRITAALGAGGMGEVYRATDTKLGREVAIKVLPTEMANDAGRLERFQREAHLLAALNHPHIAAIHGLEEADGHPFLVLELVEGEDLKERLGAAAPSDRAKVDLSTYKDLVAPWNDWSHLTERGRHWAGVLACGQLTGGAR